MRIVAIADLHGTLPRIPECDLLLIGGDVTPVWNHSRQYQARWLRGEFSTWLVQQPAKQIVGIGGNHDFVLQESETLGRELPWIYLDNSEFEVDGLKIWGSPLSPTFGNWAFMRDDRGLGEVWETIPNDVDILMVHGPMFGYQDGVKFPVGHHAGSVSLTNRLMYEEYPNLKLFVCGHIHEAYGQIPVEMGENLFVVANASLVDFNYQPVNPHMEFEL
jgi:Icc-related predicted phosphoesterase